MFKRLSFSRSVASTCLLGLGLSLSSNLSASACKGMEESVCLDEAVCIWVNAYERSDGRTVQGYCRAGNARKSLPDSEAKIETESEPEVAVQG